MTAGRATGIGSWPGDDAVASTRLTFEELGEAPHLPYLPELPGRGPGAGMTGRGAALLVDLPVDLQPSGWRLVDHAGRDQNRAQAWLRQDLDVLAEVADGYAGPLKVQVTGPWTLAATIELPRLERAVVDPGACRDIIGSLAEGVSRHLAEIARLVPGAELVLQLDEPELPAVLTGALPTASGFGRLRAVEEPVVVEGLEAVLKAAGDVPTVVHCCAAGPPVPVMLRSGAGAVSVDVAQLGQAGWEAIAAAVEGGVALWAGVVPTSGSGRPDELAERVLGPWRKLGLVLESAAEVVVTPTCGLAGSSPDGARSALRLAKAAAGALAEAANA